MPSISLAHMTRVAALLLFVCIAHLQVGTSNTDPHDVAALLSLMDQWKNTPPSWGKSADPCGTPWEGVECNNSRVTALKLLAMGIEGTLSGDIGQLSELQYIDLSNNELSGPLVPDIGSLEKLSILNLINCSFSGAIPNELGNLTQLLSLSLTSNKFTGTIPASLGCLSNLYLLDLADNQLTGSLPISTEEHCGLDQLINTTHFHFNKNRLSGPIPENLFSSHMTLIHILFDENQFTGKIPDSIGLVQTLEVLRLDRNSFSGQVPSNLNNLTCVNVLNLANNKLIGPMPDLTGMNSLNYVDLSNNTFDPTETPAWFSTIQSLTTLIIESGQLHGKVPQQLFGFPQLQQVTLKNNAFNGNLDMGDSISEQLQLVDFQNNNLTEARITNGYNKSLILVGNPVCNGQLWNSTFCSRQQPPGSPPSSMSSANCGTKSCPRDQSPSPLNCDCACPYEGVFVFRAPSFVDLTNDTTFQSLAENLSMYLDLSPGSVLLQNPFFDSDSYLQVQLKIFPSAGMYFNLSEFLRIGFELSNVFYGPPPMFGTYYFVPWPYPFPGSGGGSSKATRVISGIAVGCAVLVLGFLALGIYALRQKKGAKQAMELSSPFASWVESVGGSGSAPQLKGARWFSYEELKKSTNNFSEINEVGFGGYGKVYRGMISNGQIVAIKRARQGSMQGGLEFKTEIELLSRVHHKNLVSLVGFCFEQGELILVYEFMPNGSLRDSLLGRSGIRLDWKRRLMIALGSARGLAYLHELADPPIIHRDVKSTNILLDENLTAKVADFGLSKLVSDGEKGHVSTQVKGTLGYVDPEYYMTQELTEKSDVYSFGVVMLELITARPHLEKGRYIVREVKMAMDKNVEHYGLKEMIDPIIQNSSYLIGFGTFVELAIRCVEESAKDRPTMSDVVKEIETILNNAGLSMDFGNTKGAAHHPYNDSLPKKDVDSSGFEYSGGYSFSGKLEPK